MADDFTLDDVALAVEIPGVYDGTSAYLMRDGTWRNRWANQQGGFRWAATESWIGLHGDEIRDANRDLLDQETNHG